MKNIKESVDAVIEGAMIEILARTIQHNPDNAYAYDIRGLAYAQKCELDKSIQDFS